MTLVLLVEDEAAICLLLSEALSDAGRAETDALTPLEAYDALQRQGPEFRVLVTDINVTERGWGFGFARAAPEVNPDLAVSFITGDSEAAVRQQGVAGAMLLAKLFLPERLVWAGGNGLMRFVSSRTDRV